MLFTEDFLHYVWKFKLLDFRNLQTTEGEAVEVIAAGMRNFDSGADFQNARIKIGDTLWAGNVEIHVASADWHQHNHSNDDAYKNVILHVVYRNNQPIMLPNGKPLPTIELVNRISAELYGRYHQMVYGNQQIIPCEGTIKTVNSLSMHNWLTRVLVERLEKKSVTVINALQINTGNWEETFYQFLAANFGFKINALPFELMAKSLPQSLLAKHKTNALQIETLIFGQAGFLEDDFAEPYPLKLKGEYSYLKKKYNLVPIEKHLWKFLRLRPSNFPTVRLAQFAGLITQCNHLFSKILEEQTVAGLRKLFSTIVVNEYWDTHYRFGVVSKPAVKSFGNTSVDLLLLNTVAVFLFSYGKHYQLHSYTNRSLELLESLPLEQNHVVNEFKELGVKAKSAFESQALLELRRSYCDLKKCLQCGIGNEILNTNR
ncbi:DUF2851 domain-containing protein [Mucilaginibacter galii]|uniref:DUF2851 family protein n=1 Tax=Mucilaginibacter galii TaxID=2005073 RepID=A0A917J772_9SPHI|nr:DUF2851 family protein [Mucilaginibacter galii]GGI50363.1 hypothetical protein GCM10011425_15750 [Mucilaginibacter galii]